MQRVDAFYLFTGGKSLKPLEDFTPTTIYSIAQLPLYVARGWLQPLVEQQSVFKLKTAWSKGNELLVAISELIAEIEPALQTTPPSDKEIGWWKSYSITSALSAFETVLAAEWGMADLFLVTSLPGYDTTALIEGGVVLFPSDLLTKVPETFKDANEFGKCLAFRVPSAAGFHLHRINESVLAHYYDAVTNGKPKPKNKTIGGYLKEFEKHGAGDLKVIAALDSLRSLHRNPLLHPKESLETVDEAISLYGAIQSVMVHMLKAIPFPSPTSVPNPPTS